MMILFSTIYTFLGIAGSKMFIFSEIMNLILMKLTGHLILVRRFLLDRAWGNIICAIFQTETRYFPTFYTSLVGLPGRSRGSKALILYM